MSMEPPFLVGERLYLRSLRESDCQGPYVTWFNDERVCQGNSHHVFPYTAEGALAYVRHARETRQDLILAIVRVADEQHVGNIALQGIHPVYRSAELSIVIGDENAWGRGFGREAGTLLMRHGFETLNLHRIGCATFEGNEAMKRLALALGMKEEGRRREAAYKNGAYIDVVEYGLLRAEYHRTSVPGAPEGT